MKTVIWIVGCAVLFFIFAGCAAEKVYTEGKGLELEASGIRVLEITSGNGDMGIKGSDKAEAITVNADIEVMEDDPAEIREIIEQQLKFTLEKRANRAVLDAHFAKSFFLLSLFLDKGRSISLNIEVPSSLELNIHDGGGNLYISDMKNDLIVVDEDGTCVLENISADSIKVSDAAGVLILTNVRGKIELEDKSEDIELSGCEGEIRITDTTDSILVEQCKGPLYIDDSVGQIVVEDHAGAVTIHARGRGDVTLRNVNGEIIQNY